MRAPILRATAAAVALSGVVLLSACSSGTDAADAKPTTGQTAPAKKENTAVERTTLRQLNKLNDSAPSLKDSTVVMVDYQNTYTRGVMELDGWEPALNEGAKLLAAARKAGAPVIHIQNDAGEGSPYDTKAEIGKIHDKVAPAEGEPVITKTKAPNAFLDTGLAEELEKAGNKNVVIAGFMTNMCVQFTTAEAFLQGYQPTVVANASATRGVTTTTGKVSAEQMHQGALATITDLYGVVVPAVADLA
ncbi:isochorismatase [Streptomyces lateritius]|nr:isochorismatase [Streptomyces lateritius]